MMTSTGRALSAGAAPGAARPHAVRSSRRALLLVGTCLGVGAGAFPHDAIAAGPQPFSPGWYALKNAGGPAASAAIANAANGAGISSRNYAQIQMSLANLRRSAAAIAAMGAAQSQARAIVGGPAVPNGLIAGGIVPDSGLVSNGVAAPVTSWTGALTPVQTGPAGSPTVTVKQTARAAFLNWRSLNVGASTTLAFDQSAGGSAAPTWVALNRINDPTLSPTAILGRITAQGHVVIVNGSGIIFTPTAQVTVGSLIASTAAISNAQFNANGIYSSDSETPTFTGATAPVLVEAGARISTNQPLTATNAGGGVILLGSAVTNEGDIETPDGQTILGAGRDFVLQQGYGVGASGQTYGPVTNALQGNLASADGFGPGGTIAETVQGTAIAVSAGGGAATNAGLIEASTGDVTLVGETVTQAGVISATTSVSTRGTVHLLTSLADPLASVTLAPGSTTVILPDPASNTALDAQRATDVSGSANADAVRYAGGALPLNDQPVLPDNQYQSLIQIVSGHSVDAGAGSLAMSQGGQIQIDAPGRVLVQAGATLDVSGAVGVSVPASADQVTVSVQGFELRDNPLNRDTTLLNSTNITLDTRDLVSVASSSAYANSPYSTASTGNTLRLYTPGGLFEVSGSASNISHTIGQWVSAGGTILIAGGASGQLVAEPGSVFNLAGGSIDHQAGTLALTWLIGPNGRLYNAATAPSTLTYSGVYDGFNAVHKRWNITSTIENPLVAPSSVQEQAYVEGRDGGTLEISEPTIVLNGTVNAGVIAGPQQTQAHTALGGDTGYLEPENAVPLPGQVLIGNYGGAAYGAGGLLGGYDTTVTLQDGAAALPAGFGPATALPAASVGTATLDAGALDGAGLGMLSIATSGSITVAAPVSVAPGGTVALHAPTVAVDAGLTARAGSVSLGDVLSGGVLPAAATTGGFSLTPTVTANGVTAQAESASVAVAPGVAIDLRGQWTNLFIDRNDVTGEASSTGGSLTIDTTGALTLGAGSLVDVSSGAVLSAKGTLGGGGGGSVTLIGDDPTGNPAYDTLTTAARLANPALSAASALPVTLAGTIRAGSVAGGGTLTLRAPGVLIAADPASGGLDLSGRTVVTPAFFDAGFSSYSLDGYGNLPLPPGSVAQGSAASVTAADLPGVEVAPGVAVAPVVPVYLATASSLIAPTGSDPETAAGLYLPPLELQNQVAATLTQRAGASLTLLSRTFSPELAAGSSVVPLDGGGSIALDPGASIAVDPAHAVTLEAVGQITVDGAITAPGGSITLQNDTYEPGLGAGLAAVYDPDLSIWIGGQAALNTAGVATTALDRNGRAYGLAGSGGTITIGGAPVVSNNNGSFAESTDAAVIVRPGAVLDASGSAASVDLSAGQALAAAPQTTALAGAGGTISLNSTSAIVLDGTLRAAAGGTQAAGGTLEVDLVTPTYGQISQNSEQVLTGVPDALRVQREIVVSQAPPASTLPADLAPGDSVAGVFGAARLGADQVTDGGFANLVLAGDNFAGFGPADVRFDGAVTLSAAESISLPAVLTETSSFTSVTIRAPYVTLNQNATVDYFDAPLANATSQTVAGVTSGIAGVGVAAPAVSGTANANTLTVDAGQLLLQTGELQGLRITSALNAVGTTLPTTVFDAPGFANANLDSAGDTQIDGTFIGGPVLNLTDAQLTPTGNSTLAVPLDTGVLGAPIGKLTIARTPGTDAAPPLTIGQSLTLIAGDLEQGGVVRAGLGTINLGLPTNSPPPLVEAGVTDRVDLLPGSVTSVSIAGQTVLDGGTQDGVIYNGTTSFAPSIVVSSLATAIDPGATLDLRGGGTLAGAGFNSGRGGSTDVLTVPFLQFSGTSATLPNDEVFAIVPGLGATQDAPALAFPYASNVAPQAGEQVTIGAGAPGLAAGTYTLQPAYDALLPGAFRIEIGNSAALPGTTGPTTNLSTLVAGRVGIAGTPILASRPVDVIVTSGADVRRLSSYDEETPAAFTVAQASLLGQTRGYVVADAGTLTLNYNIPTPKVVSLAPALSVGGQVLFDAGAGGRGGTVDVVAAPADGATFANIDVIGDAAATGTALGGTANPGDTVVLRASDLDRLAPETLSIGGTTNVATTSFAASSAQVQVEDNATLSAPQIFLLGASGVTLADGASLDTLGNAIPNDQIAIALPYGNAARAGRASAALIVSNASPDFSPPATGGGLITIGAGASLLSQGTVALDTSGAVTVSDGAVFGTRALYLAVSSVNVTPAGGAPAGDTVPTGITLSQSLLNTLTAGGVVPGAPALRSLTAVASNSVNFIGTAGLSLAGNSTLEFDTPSIYGLGAATDNATISAGTFIWNGIAQPSTNPSLGGYASALPAGILSGGPGTGSGTLTVAANTIILGYAPGVVPLAPAVPPATGTPVLNRNTYGFSTVTLGASDRVVASNSGTLSVYETQGAYADGGFANSGGNLAIVTPLLTSNAGAILRVDVGGAITLASPGTLTSPGTLASQGGAAGGLGGEIDLTGQSIALGTAVALPEGKLALTANGDIGLGAGAAIDLAGVGSVFFDQTVAGPGGVLTAESTTGNITADPASVIDVSSAGAQAGTIDVTATAGTVSLAGAIRGGGAPGGTLDVRAGTLSDFAGLNQRLTAGGLTGSRRFEIATGDLTVESADQVRASAVSLSVDGGNLTIDGLINASGPAPGSISLSAGGNLTLTSDAVLDAHGDTPQTDSLGNTIDAENTAHVTLRVADGANGSNLAATGTPGLLTIASGATIDVAAPAGVVCALGPCGEVEIDVPRLGGADGTNGDLSIAAAGPIAITGAGSVAVNGFWSYAPADGVIVQTASQDPTGMGIGLDTINAANAAFIASALPGGALNAGLAAKLAGLTSYASAFHLRPGVEIDSSTASGGDLTVEGDLDLSGLRYASLNAATPLTAASGSGEPGVLVLRAANNLSVNGSITDGFAPPVDDAANQNPDDNGWQLYSTGPNGIANPLDQNVIIPAGAGPIDIGGSTFAIQNVALNYDLPVAAQQTIAAGVTLPTAITLASAETVPQGGIVAQANVLAPDGTTVLFQRGSLIPGGTVLPANATLSAGFLVFTPAGSTQAGIVFANTDLIWPAGASLADFGNNSGSIQLAASVPLAAGDLIPGGGSFLGSGGTTISFADFASSVALRPTITFANGLSGQGQVFGAANLLPPGSLSWSISLVGGAATAAADPLALLPATVLAASGPNSGDLVLSDLHYQQLTAGGLATPLTGFSVIRTGTGSLNLLAGGSLDEASTYGIYTAGTQSPGVIGGAFDQKAAAYPGNDPTVTSNLSAEAVYQAIDASFPRGGGDVTVVSQGVLQTTSLVETNVIAGGPLLTGSNVGDWLLLQGDGSAANPGSWSINFGTYSPVPGAGGAAILPILTGFTGIGTLGGGNLTVTAASAGQTAPPDVLDLPVSQLVYDQSFSDLTGSLHSQALDLAVGGTGRETAAGLALTGGGRLSLTIGNALDAASFYNAQFPTSTQSTIVDLRGSVTVQAGSIAAVDGSVGLGAPTTNPYGATPGNGPDIVLGDATARIETRGDLAIGQTSDPGLQPTLATNAQGGLTWFTLWQPTTALDLFSAGGDISPNYVAGVGTTITTPTLSAVAASGNIYALTDNNGVTNAILETAPSAVGQLQFLAGGSIVAGSGYTSNATTPTAGPVIAQSGADPTLLPTVADPAFTGETGTTASNTTAAADTLFAFTTDQPTTFLHAADPVPARFYAATGDIEDLSTGYYDPTSNQIIGAKPVRIMAGDDIVTLDRTANSGLLWQNTSNDISVISAANNIYYANAKVAGPGLLEVSAGGNIDQTDTSRTSGGALVAGTGPSNLVSLGYLIDKTAATQEQGAGITVSAGAPTGTTDLAAFAQLYFNPANLADSATPLQNQPGKVVRTYQSALLAFLQARGYQGDAAGALAAFLALPANVQQILVLRTYYAELNQSGLDYANPASRFYKSYSEGTEAIKALFPGTDTSGQSPASGGSLTLTGNSGITTEFGGAIQIVDPTGATTVGVPGTTPGSTAGIITQGSGDVDVYSYGSVLLGQSRIFTTFGGNLLIWLEGNGEVNGGQGAKSTIIFTPPNITYDALADISLSPTVPSTGAGLAVLAPVAGVPAGDINLVSPFGTIDAGEAGIRSSGNVNLVALTVLNAANVQAGGKVSGVPTAAVPNVAAITAASAASGAAQNAAQNNLKPAASQQTPSIITVNVVGTGVVGTGVVGSGQSGSSEDGRKRKRGT